MGNWQGWVMCEGVDKAESQPWNSEQAGQRAPRSPLGILGSLMSSLDQILKHTPSAKYPRKITQIPMPESLASSVQPDPEPAALLRTQTVPIAPAS